MNILIDNIDLVVKKRIQVPFNTDFRYGILFELLMQETKVSDKVKTIEAIKLFYPQPELVKDYKKAVKDILWFYCGGVDEELGKETKQINTQAKQIYSYEYDQEYIYAAFYNQYGIDLQDAKIHWWKFKALWNGLYNNNKIIDIMSYRSINVEQIKDKEEKARIRKLKKIYALPDMRTEAQKENDFGSAFL